MRIFFVVATLLLSNALAFSSASSLFPLCSDTVADIQATAYATLSGRSKWSACPSEDYLIRLHSFTNFGERHMLDIGANRGYSAAEIFDIWAPQVDFSCPALHHYLREAAQLGVIPELGKEAACGSCRDCHFKAHAGGSRANLALHVYSFEPSPKTYQVASNAAEHFFKSPERSKWGSWTVNWGACADKPGTVQWPNECATRACSMDETLQSKFSGNSAFTEVRLWTVDSYMEDKKIPHVDYMKIDAEGFDSAVIRGAAATLQAQKVSMFLFEFNTMGLWKNTTLRSVLDVVEGYGYVCYMAGRPFLARLTNCWHEQYEAKQWSNVLCALENGFAGELEQLSFMVDFL